MSERISALARRVQDDPFFLASALADYAHSEDLDERGLATVLDCSQETLDLLRLCRRPRPAAPSFRTDVDRIAARFGVRAATLTEMVRRADVLAALRHDNPSGQGLLLAARDREEPNTGDADVSDDEEQEP